MHFSAEVSETLRHQTHGAEMSWVRSVIGPKCQNTFYITAHSVFISPIRKAQHEVSSQVHVTASQNSYWQ